MLTASGELKTEQTITTCVSSMSSSEGQESTGVTAWCVNWKKSHCKISTSQKEKQEFTPFAYLLHRLYWETHNPRLKDDEIASFFTCLQVTHILYKEKKRHRWFHYWIYWFLVSLQWVWGETSWRLEWPCHSWAVQSVSALVEFRVLDKMCMCVHVGIYVFNESSFSPLWRKSVIVIMTVKGWKAFPLSPLLASLDIRVNTEPTLSKCFCCNTARNCQIQMVMLTSQ